jgi:pimeloyl-ACP methyl ester carboxylesterase
VVEALAPQRLFQAYGRCDASLAAPRLARLPLAGSRRPAARLGDIGRIRAPLLLIHGDDDRDTPVYHARALAAAQPAATLWIVPGAAHSTSWRAEPTEFPRRIVAFFRGHE